MGFERKRKIFKLVFTGDEDLEGLEVYTRSLSVGQMLQLVKLADKAGMVDGDPETVDTDKLSPENVAAVEAMLGYFAKALKSWNLEDNGKPVPATLKGVQDQDLDFILRLIGEWMSAIGGVSPSLGKASSSGPLFPAVSIPQVTRSPSP